jgi:hypothetical protein
MYPLSSHGSHASFVLHASLSLSLLTRDRKKEEKIKLHTFQIFNPKKISIKKKNNNINTCKHIQKELRKKK